MQYKYSHPCAKSLGMRIACAIRLRFLCIMGRHEAPSPPRPVGVTLNKGLGCFKSCCRSHARCGGAQTEECHETNFCGTGICCELGVSANGGPCQGLIGCEGRKCCTDAPAWMGPPPLSSMASVVSQPVAAVAQQPQQQQLPIAYPSWLDSMTSPPLPPPSSLLLMQEPPHVQRMEGAAAYVNVGPWDSHLLSSPSGPLDPRQQQQGQQLYGQQQPGQQQQPRQQLYGQQLYGQQLQGQQLQANPPWQQQQGNPSGQQSWAAASLKATSSAQAAWAGGARLQGSEPVVPSWAPSSGAQSSISSPLTIVGLGAASRPGSDLSIGSGFLVGIASAVSRARSTCST